MKKPSSVKCENCMFAAPSKMREGYPFTCHFNPPIVTETSHEPGWPIVSGVSWCGRFRPVDNLTAVEWVAWQKGLEEDVKAK
jgi:hypothetical protein